MALQDIIKTDAIITIPPGDTIVSALSKLHTSHDAAFVFDKDKTFRGLVNPYYCIIKSSLPGNAKIESCIYHPPKLDITTPTNKAAQLMIDSKVHYLPVFDKDRFAGIISARRLLAKRKYSPKLDMTIADVLRRKHKQLVTIHEDEFVSKALATFKTAKVSKLIVVNREGKLRGIMTYYDLILFLMEPRRRNQKDGTVSLGHQIVRNFMKTLVLTLPDTASMRDALRLIMEKQIGSVVVVNPQKQPIGIITTSDFLHLLRQESPQTPVELSSQNVSPHNRHVVRHFFLRIRDRIQRGRDIDRARILVREEKRGNLFQVVLALFPKRGKPTIIKKEGRDLKSVLKEVKDRDKRAQS